MAIVYENKVMSSDVPLFKSDKENSNACKSSSEVVASDNLDECDVIAETPQKFKKKKSFKKSKKIIKRKTSITSAVQNCSNENIQHYLSDEFCVARNDTKFVNTNNYEVENINVRYKSPYAFFEIKEVLSFTELHQPLNGNVKMIGVYKQKYASLHYLMEFKKSCANILPLRILIDFKLSNSFPLADQAIEVYGFVKFCRKDATCFPVFLVKFWTNISSDFNGYLKCLRQQKLYVPNCYNKITDFYINEMRDLEISRSIDYSFDEIDESCLNKNVEHLEQICHEIDQIMNINEDVFR